MKKLINEYALTFVSFICASIGINIFMYIFQSDYFIKFIQEGIYGL